MRISKTQRIYCYCRIPEVPMTFYCPGDYFTISAASLSWSESAVCCTGWFVLCGSMCFAGNSSCLPSWWEVESPRCWSPPGCIRSMISISRLSYARHMVSGNVPASWRGSLNLSAGFLQAAPLHSSSSVWFCSKRTITPSMRKLQTLIFPKV